MSTPLANRISHPLNITLRQDTLLDPLDEWLAAKFDPPHLPATISELAGASAIPAEPRPEEDQMKAEIAECDRKLARYRATLDAGAEPATVGRWITETETQRARCQAAIRALPSHAGRSMSREEITSMVTVLSDLLGVLRAG
jgi:site-specific DNA recombinase